MLINWHINKPYPIWKSLLVNFYVTNYLWSASKNPCWTNADYARSQLHSARAPAVRSTSYKTEWMVLRGWRSVNLSHLFAFHPPKIGLLLTKREQVGSKSLGQPWSYLDSDLLIGTSIILPWCSEAMLAIWSERLAKGPYQKNTPAAQWGSNLQSIDYAFQAFYQLNYAGPQKLEQ